MPVPFLDLKIQYRQIREEIEKELAEVLETCNYVLGPKVAAFEDRFAGIAGTRHCIAVSSGTAAVHLMIWASDLPSGSGIIVPPNTFTASAEGIVLAGHIPVFVDVERSTLNLSPQRVEELLRSASAGGRPLDPKTGAEIRGILAVDLYGQPAALPELERIAREYDLVLFEDACQAHDASRDGRPAGSFGDAAAFSFYPGKNLGAFGEGGAVTTDSDELAARVRSLRDHGSREKYYYEFIGHNYRMTAFQGAVLGVKVKYITTWNDRRIAAAGLYRELLDGLPLTLPVEAGDVRHVYHLYAVHTPERDELQKHLGELNIASGLHYPLPLHVQKAYSHLGYGKGDFPISEWNSSCNITLPMFPDITKEQQETVAEGLKAFFAGR
ncbi:MAG: DegT/DnrJ/EryC1/StrS family aminotransferase [Candidatus Fermentibacteraceae bacterium]|nr:DegT/DnrJ/EryC1/StrS family aminotransferase [Candidatus Fermentibacteraceae bacterium]MBN2608046.1 DegT/DnrJ/EryC1/StrS family aminotransferase [Candidatus Fermentibacteraceae bacterium]